MSLLPKDIRSILVVTSSWAIEIPISLYKMENGKIANTTTTVDSGATISCIDQHFIQQIKWLLPKLPKPQIAWNADRTANKAGLICHQISLHVWIGEKEAQETFLVISLGGRDKVILGYPWLTQSNPWIHWEKGEVCLIQISGQIPRNVLGHHPPLWGDQCKEYSQAMIPTMWRRF